MFETVAPETFESRSKRVLYETLPVSIALHAIGIAAAIVIAVWNVVFPTQSPRIIRAYSLVTIPEPPPPPAAPRPTQPKQAEVMKPPPDLDKIVAPTIIPESIPSLPDPPPPSIALAPAPAPPVAETGPAGGSSDGKVAGEVDGKLHGTAMQFFPSDGRVHIDRSQSLPLLPVSQEYPQYPEKAKKQQLEDTVVVRYIIGKNGRVISVEIIDHAKEAMFDEATVDAIKQWRFRPMIKDGKPVEVVHELAVNYELIRH